MKKDIRETMAIINSIIEQHEELVEILSKKTDPLSLALNGSIMSAQLIQTMNVKIRELNKKKFLKECKKLKQDI